MGNENDNKTKRKDKTQTNKASQDARFSEQEDNCYIGTKFRGFDSNYMR